MPTTNLTSQQQRVYDWLRDELDLPVFAEAYEAAVHLLNARTPGYITFVSHVGRDFMNYLAGTVAGTSSPQVQYRRHANDITEVWRDEWGGPGLVTGGHGSGEHDNLEGHVVTYEACSKVKKLLEEHAEGSKRDNAANYLFFRTFLDYEYIDMIPKNLAKDWKEAKSWFQAHTHCRRGCFSEDEQHQIEKHFQTLHSALYVAASTFERLKEVNDILEETNR